ncbi:hypothetical protein B277_10755 [Janibacter hoylei PVAS-1]|uniref:Uncharacterized protein n=1 Tax=Janibacter hoylei PVAS-1 TaxID=1210046 RepID=K1DWE0_9MICO|nr:hypothetical protein B277_10755 [Janibacter hoylei PVAS-1]
MTVAVDSTGPTGRAARPGRTARQAAGLVLDEATVAALRAQLPRVASVVVAEVMQQVPAYDVPFQGRMGKIIERAVQVSLASFVGLASGTAPKTAPVGVGVAAASELGQAEAKRGAAGRGAAVGLPRRRERRVAGAVRRGGRGRGGRRDAGALRRAGLHLHR